MGDGWHAADNIFFIGGGLPSKFLGILTIDCPIQGCGTALRKKHVFIAWKADSDLFSFLHRRTFTKSMSVVDFYWHVCMMLSWVRKPRFRRQA